MSIEKELDPPERLSLEQKEFLIDCWASDFRAPQIRSLFAQRFAIVLNLKLIHNYNAGKAYNRMPREACDGRAQIHRALIERYDQKRAEWEQEKLRLDPRATKAGRAVEKMRRHDLLKEVIEARQQRAQERFEQGDQTVLAEELTGTTVREWKHGQMVVQVDKGLLERMESLEDGIQEELGQKLDRKDITSGGKPLTNPVVIYLPDNGRDPSESSSESDRAAAGSADDVPVQ